MKNPKRTPVVFDHLIQLLGYREKVRGASRLLLALLAAAACAGNQAQSANILVNPGFESTPIFTAGSWTTHTTESWSMNAATTIAGGGLIRTGANGLWTQGLYLNGGAPAYYNMYAYQKIAAAPGSTFTADAWFSQYSSYYQHQGGDNGAGSGLFTSDADGVEECWVEVQFLDVSNNILADYRSAILSPVDATLPGSAGVKTINVYNWPTLTNVIPNVATNIYLDWIHCQVTNQFVVSNIGPNSDPSTNTVNNTLGDGVMTAPPGTAYVQYMLCLAQARYEAGANYWDDCSLNQLGGPSPSVISGLSPAGTQFFYTNTTLSFNVVSASTGGAALPTNPVNGIKVMVNGVDQSANLQFSGTDTAWSVTLPNLASNSLYNVSITVSNSAGLITTASTSFDTFNPAFIVSVEDYDYDGGNFIQNPIPTTTADANSYFGRAGTLGIDMSTYNGTGILPAGPSTLAPNYPNRTDGNVAFEVSSDIQLPLYSAQNNPGIYNVDLSYNNAGNWFNYTRDPYPAGTYEVFARISGGQGAGAELLNLVTSGYGTSTQTTNNLGQFYLANGTDWGHYYWIPLTDADGNIVAVNVPSGRQTLQLCSAPIAGENVISFIFVPFPSAGVPPSVSNISPANGTAFANPAAGISFTVTPAASTTVDNSGIQLILNGGNVSSSLNISGSSTKNVSFGPLVANTLYTAVINVTNTGGVGVSRTVQFDTMSTGNFYFKMDDWDYNGGSYDTSGNGLVPYAYVGLNSVTNIDYSLGSAMNNAYRGPDGLHLEDCSDVTLPGYSTGSGWWDVGNFDAGQWANYTRNYPAGKYYVYGRLAGYNGNVTLAKVTAGQGTVSQTLQTLGVCYTSTANQGWQNWNWCLMYNNGEPAVVNLGGINTLRTTSSGNVNANYFMLVPVQSISIKASASGNNVVVSFPTVVGQAYRVFARASVSTGAWTQVGSVGGDGTVKSVSIPATGSQQFYQVTSP